MTLGARLPAFRARVLVLALALLAVTGPARAADPLEARAREHFLQAEAHFRAGRFGEAATAYEAAYKTKALPAFLFNLGQCYRNLGQLARATTYFKAYLLDAPGAPNRASVQRTIRELDLAMRAGLSPPAPSATAAVPVAPPAVAEAGRAPAPVAPPPRVPLPLAPLPSGADLVTPVAAAAARGTSPAPRPLHRRWWFWTGLSVLVAGGVAAAVVTTRPGTSTPPATLGTIFAQPGGRP